MRISLRPPNRLWRLHSFVCDRDVVRFQPPFWRFDNHVHAGEFTGTLLHSGQLRFPVSKGWAGTYNDPFQKSNVP